MKKASKRVSSDLFLILTSLAMAFVVWMIAKEGDLGQVAFPVQLELIDLPENMETAYFHGNMRIADVRVTLSAPKSLVVQLQANHFLLQLDWNDLPKPPEWNNALRFKSTVTLKESHVIPSPYLDEDQKERIARNALYLSIVPRKINVEVSHITRRAVILIPTAGKPAAGYELAKPITLVDPSEEILVTATNKRFFELGVKDPNAPLEIQADAVDLTGHDRDFTEILTFDDNLPAGVKLAPPGDQRIEAKATIRSIAPAHEDKKPPSGN